MANIALILSGGTGSRLGADIPKQYLKVGGKPIISYCLSTFVNNMNIDAIVVVLDKDWRHFVEEALICIDCYKDVFYADQGTTRQYSIYNGLIRMKECGVDDNDIVIIHDAARPLCDDNLINRCLEGCKKADGVMPGIKVKDTIYLSEDGRHINALLDRSQLVAGQSPEAFMFGKYFNAHQSMSTDELMKINGSTELAYKAGLDCMVVDGDPMNFKITTPEDLMNFESILMNKD